MGVFKEKIANAKPSFSSNYLKEGRYWALVNGGKNDKHANTGTDQLIYESTVIYVENPGPPEGKRWPASNNAGPHRPGDDLTFYFAENQTGSEARAVAFICACLGAKKDDLPLSINPRTGAPVIDPRTKQAVAPGTPIDPSTGDLVPPTHPGAVVTVSPIAHAIDLSTDARTNFFGNVVLDVTGNGINTKGKGGKPPGPIIATNYNRRVPASEVQAIWDKLDPKAQEILLRKPDGGSMTRLERMLAGEAAEKAARAKA